MARVVKVIVRMHSVPAELVTLDKTFEELQIDSLDGINIMFELEGEFKVDIPDAAVQSIRSVREMVDGIEALLAEKASTLATLPRPIIGEELP
jgi:acyl carrier protein